MFSLFKKRKQKPYNWKKEHTRLWDSLVPTEGEADTIQGEMIRITGKLTDQAFRNGNINWTPDHERMWRFVGEHLDDAESFTEQERTLIREKIQEIIQNHETPDVNEDRSAYYFISEKAVDWCMAHPNLIPDGGSGTDGDSPPGRGGPATVVSRLIYACVDGDLEHVRRMVAEGTPVDGANEVNHTPLMAAARYHHVPVVEFLLGVGADVHRRDMYGHTPLHWSVAERPGTEPFYRGELQRDCVRLLIERGAAIDAQDDDGGTPLMKAAWFGCLPSIVELLDHGASVSIRDAKGRSAEELARQRGHSVVAEMLASRTQS
jgi:hypothetical protein